MSQRKFVDSIVTSIREERLLVEFGDKIGLTLGEAVRRGILWTAEAQIVSGYLPEPLIDEYNALKEGDVEYLTAKHIASIKQRLNLQRGVTTGNSPQSPGKLSAPSLLNSVKSVFSSDELRKFHQLASSNQVRDNQTALFQIRNLYETRTGTPAPFWSPADELSILNELIDLAGV